MQLKEFFFKISFLYAFIPVNFLMKLARKKVIFPFYHFIDDGETNFVSYLYNPKTKSEFIKDIRFFKKHFTSLSINDLTSEKKDDALGFLLSFDDGLSNFYNVVAPILLEEKVFAINFLNSDFIDNKDLFYRYKVNLILETIAQKDLSKTQKEEVCKFLEIAVFNQDRLYQSLKKCTIHQTEIIDKLSEIVNINFVDFLNEKKPYMSYNQVVDLIGKGFFMGAHSKNHPRYSDIDLESQLNQTIESITSIKEKFNLEECSFAFPFSDDGVTKEFFKKISVKNVKTFGSSGLKDEDLESHFQRIPMEYNSVYSAKTIVKGELVYYILKRMFGFHKTKRY